jgi:hypothetical protein
MAGGSLRESAYAGEWGNIVAAKVFIQVIWFTCREQRANY